MTAAQLLYLFENGDKRILMDHRIFKDVIEHAIYIQPMDEDEAQQLKLIKLNSTQDAFIDEYFRQIQERKSVRIITLKGRRCGVSTVCACITLIEMMCKPGLRAMVVAPKLGRQSKSIFQQLYFNMLKKLPVSEERKEHRREQGGFMLYNGESVLRVDFEEELIGIGLDIMHITEAAYFADLGGYLSHANPCIAEGGRNMIVIESTSRSYGNVFHKQWQKSEAKESSYVPLFFSWFSHEFNQLPFYNKEERDALARDLTVGHDERWGNETDLKEKHGLSLEQLKWRRAKIRDLVGGLAEFHREYPSTAEEAFLQSSANVFKPAALKYQRTEVVREPEMRGEFDIISTQHHEAAPHFSPTSRPGLAQVYGKPKTEAEYVIGADISEGRQDFSVATVLSRRPLEVVSVLRGNDNRNLEPLEFANQLFHLGRYYNSPPMVIENNAAGSSVIMALDRMGYNNMMTMADLFPNAPNVSARSDEIGWRNTKATKRILVDLIINYIDNRMVAVPDLGTVDEMMNFVKMGLEEGKEDKYQAAMKGKYRRPGQSELGHYDDRIFALMGALAGHLALGTPRSKRDMMLEMEFHDHDIMAADVGTLVDNEYDPFGDPFGYDFDSIDLSHTFMDS